MEDPFIIHARVEFNTKKKKKIKKITQKIERKVKVLDRDLYIRWFLYLGAMMKAGDFISLLFF